jgi:hypothetical protein
MWILGAILFFFFGSLYEAYDDGKRKSRIMAHKKEWGRDICNIVIAKNVELGMTMEMVKLAWGTPAETSSETTLKADKNRWVYGEKRVNARYVYFTDGRVTQIKHTKKRD